MLAVLRDTPITATADGFSIGASDAAVADRSRSSDERTLPGVDLAQRSLDWSPWRGYAALHLWAGPGD